MSALRSTLYPGFHQSSLRPQRRRLHKRRSRLSECDLTPSSAVNGNATHVVTFDAIARPFSPGPSNRPVLNIVSRILTHHRSKHEVEPHFLSLWTDGIRDVVCVSGFGQMSQRWDIELHDMIHGNDEATASTDFVAGGRLPTGGRGLLALTLWVRDLDRARFRFQRVWQCGRVIGHLYRVHYRGNFDYDCSNIDTSGTFRRFHRNRQEAESPRFKKQFELLRNHCGECERPVLIRLRHC